jgi:hypothetical protein
MIAGSESTVVRVVFDFLGTEHQLRTGEASRSLISGVAQEYLGTRCRWFFCALRFCFLFKEGKEELKWIRKQ